MKPIAPEPGSRPPQRTAQRTTFALIGSALLAAAACSSAHAPAAQNPSPMVDHARAHARLDTAPPDGIAFRIDGVLPRPIPVFVPARFSAAPELSLVVHFHGAVYVPMHAAAAQEVPVALATVHLGAGSAVYERGLADTTVLMQIRQAIADTLTARRSGPVTLPRTVLSGFSAGYGAIRAILRQPGTAATIDGVLLLDGLHVSYIPDRTPVAAGGMLDSANLAPFVHFARSAVRGERAMLITHSEIFPGTFASTTETSDYLLRVLAVPRTPVLEWGPVGMQHLSAASSGTFAVMGFAGNTAPDHIDHFHGMPVFLARLLAMVNGS